MSNKHKMSMKQKRQIQGQRTVESRNVNVPHSMSRQEAGRMGAAARWGKRHGEVVGEKQYSPEIERKRAYEGRRYSTAPTYYNEMSSRGMRRDIPNSPASRVAGYRPTRVVRYYPSDVYGSDRPMYVKPQYDRQYYGSYYREDQPYYVENRADMAYDVENVPYYVEKENVYGKSYYVVDDNGDVVYDIEYGEYVPEEEIYGVEEVVYADEPGYYAQNREYVGTNREYVGTNKEYGYYPEYRYDERQYPESREGYAYSEGKRLHKGKKFIKQQGIIEKELV
jgi:hypothetical protein